MRGRDFPCITKEFKEPLIDSEIPAAQGCAAVFNRRKRLKTKGSENDVFRFLSLSSGAEKYVYEAKDAIIHGRIFQRCVDNERPVRAADCPTRLPQLEYGFRLC